MKMISAALMSAALATALTGGLQARQAADGMAGMDMSKMPASAAPTSYPAVGVVKSVDATGGKVTIAHQAIQGLNWPAMTMTFMVKDRALFAKLAVDRKVHFQLAKQGGEYVVTDVN